MKSTKRLRVKIRKATRALEDKNFRLFFIGQSISYTGVWINSVAMGWLTYRLTGSAALLGIVTFVSQFPSFMVTPFAGVQIDRLDRKKVLQVCLSLSAFQSLMLGVLTITGTITVSQLIILGIFQGIIDGFYLPARQAFISELVSDKSNLGNAIALNASSFHLARFIGPAIGGLLIGVVGEGPCFLIDACTYSAILYSLLYIDRKRSMISRQSFSVWQELSDGIQYIRNSEKVRILISFTGFMCLIGIGHTVLLPVLVHSVFHSDASSLGLLMGASGFGSLLGAIYLAIKGSEESIKKRILVSSVVFGIAIMFLAMAPRLWLCVPILVACGFCFISIAAGSNTIIQTTVKDQYRGRVMGFFSMCFTGMMPIGSIGSGWLADQLGVRATLLLIGAFATVGGVLLQRQRERI